VGKLIILAGSGELPLQCQKIAKEHETAMVSLTRASNLKRLIQTLESLKAKGFRDMVVAGGLPRTQALSNLNKDPEISKFISNKLTRSLIGGDDFLLTNAFAYLRLKGFRPISQQRLLKPLLARQN